MPVLYLDCIPDSLDVDRDSDGFIVEALAVGDGSQIVSLIVRLDPMPDHGIDTYEASFGFLILDTDGGEPAHFTQDRFEVEAYFDGCSKDEVLPTVCAALTLLVSEIQPTYIYRVTKGIDLPQKAMIKHLLITDHLLGLGYQTVDEGTDDLNRLFWLMGR
ncbi:MAG: hypothetical protein H6915_00185 [Novosphingobium sp.]|nr:hypothetical protein [Novosphingobium sp.]